MTDAHEKTTGASTGVKLTNVGWSFKVAKNDIYPTSLPTVKERITALRPLWQHAYAGVLPLIHASCSPLYLRLDVEEAVATAQLGGAREQYTPFTDPVQEDVASAVLRATGETLSRLHACGVVHSLLHIHAVLHHNNDEQRVVLLGAEVPVSALVPQGALGREARRCAAPEILRGDPYGAAADVWGLGVLLLQLLSRAVQLPDASSCPTSTSDLADSDFLSPFLSALSPRVVSFVLPCLKSDPVARPLLWDLLQHPFLSPDPCHNTADGAVDKSEGGGSSSVSNEVKSGRVE